MRVIAALVPACLAAASLAAMSPDQIPTRSATDGMWLMRPADPKTGENYGMIPGAFVRVARARLDGLADMAMFGMATERLSLAASPDDKRGLSVSEITPGALRVVGIPPIIGREFSDEDLRGVAVALVTYQVWQGHFGGRPDAVGDRLWRGASGQPRDPVIIVGVLPRDFFQRVPVADSAAAAFIPSDVFVRRGMVDGSFAPLLRLRPGVAIDKVRAEVNQAVDSVRSQVGDPVGKLNARLDPADRPGWMK